MKNYIFFLISFFTFTSINAQLSEDFEGSTLPDASGNWTLSSGDWKILNNEVGLAQSWKVNTSTTFTYQGIGRSVDVQREFIGQGNTSEDWLVTPRKLIRPNEQLRFYTRQGLTGDSGTIYEVRISTNPDPTIKSAYTLFKSYTEDELLGASPAIFSDYNEKVISFIAPQIGQQLFIAFVKVHTQLNTPVSGDRWLIDNVQLALRCLEPTNLNTVDKTCDSAKVTWSNPANAPQFEYEWGTTSFVQGTGTLVTTTSGLANNPSNLITGLLPDTVYEYYVRAVCDPSRTSNWFGPYIFRTLATGSTCTCPINVTTIPYSSLGNTLDFGDNVLQISPGQPNCGTTGDYLEGADVVYKYTPAATGQINISMNPFGSINTSVFVYSSCANIGVNCLAGVANTNGNIRNIPVLNVTINIPIYIVISSQALPLSFEYLLTIQQVTCPAPIFTTLSAMPNTNSVSLGWGPQTGVTNWEYAVQTAGSQIPSGAGTPTNSNLQTNPQNIATQTLSGALLTSGTSYQYWVRADCGNGTYSPWSGPFLFNTTICVLVDQCNYTFVLNDSGADGWEGARMEVRQNGLVLSTLGNQITGGTATVTVALCDDIPFELFWSEPGTNPAEVGVLVRNSFAQTLFNMPFNNSGSLGTILYTNIAECDYPECLAPTGALTANTLTTYGATLQWTSPVWAIGNLYDVYIVSAPFAVPTTLTTPTFSGVSPGFIIPQSAGLIQDTQYRYWIRTVCTNNGPSPWTTNSGTFTTLPSCPRPTALLVGPMTTDNLAIPPTASVPVSWTSVSPPANSWFVKALPVQVPALPTPTYTVGDPTWFATGSSSYTFQGTTGLIPDTAYNYYVVSDCGTINGNSFVAGPKAFTTPPSCPRPTLFAVTNASITTTSATFTWTNGTAGDTQWEILLVPSLTPTLPTVVPPDNPSFPGQILQTVNTPNQSPFQITGLNPATIYYYYIRTVCSATNKSKWTAVKVFNTITCDPLDKCDYNLWLYNFEGNQIGANTWNNARLQIRQNGIVVQTVGTAQINGLPIIVKICPNVPFDLYWSIAGTSPQTIGIILSNPKFDIIYEKNAGVGSPLSILYSSVGDCSSTGCLKPIPLVVNPTSITDTTAQLTWTEQGTSTQWEVYVRPFSSTPPFSPTTPSNGSVIIGTIAGNPVGNGVYYLTNSQPLILSGLTPGTTYQYFVRAICSPTSFSNWTILTPISFITKPINDDCIGAINVPVNPTRICAQFAVGNTIGATASTPNTLPACPGSTDDDVWFTFTATNAIHIININNIIGGTTDMNHTLYSGEICNALTQLYCSNPNTSIATNLIPGNIYKIRVYTNGSVISQTVSFEVCITTPAPIVNDNCATATSAVVNGGLICTLTTPGSLTGATPSTQGGTTCAGTEDDDVWFSFVANSTTQIIDLLNIQGTSLDLNHALYSGLCTNLNLIYCSDPNQSTANNLVINQTYFIRVWSASNTIQDITFDLCIGRIPPPISANVTQYTKQQLIEDILLKTTCANVTNITWSTGTNFPANPAQNYIPVNGIGYFNKEDSEFPFEDGIVLSTGNAATAEGPNDPNDIPQSDGGGGFPSIWPGDDELEAIILAGTGQPMDSNNATKLEFDFTPLSNIINFNFLFASEEYGTFQCTFSDSFAFILTDLTTGTVSNLAVIPNTTIPVSVVTIRDELYNDDCNSQNPDYFGEFYGPATFGGNPGLNPLGDPITYNGLTVPLTATSAVVAGNPYHIKLVIADRLDTAFDSAVFIEGGSFDIGNVQLGGDFLEATGNALCPNDEITINTGLDPLQYTFTWFLNDIEIIGQTGATLLVNAPGVYKVIAQFLSSSCTGFDTLTIEYIEDVNAGIPNDLIVCDPVTSSVFDLTENQTPILLPFVAGTHTLIGYFTSLADAIANTNTIVTPSNYTNTSSPQTIWVRVNRNGSTCYQIVDFEIRTQDLTPIFTIAGNLQVCSNSSTTLSVVPTNNNFDITLVTFQWQLNGVDIIGQTNDTITVSAPNFGTYTCIVTNTGCEGTQSVIVVEISSPLPPTTGGDQTQCETLPIQTLTATATAPTGASLVWYDAATLGAVVTTPILNACGTVTYYAESQVGTPPNICVSATRTAVTLTINCLPLAPTTGGDQTQCETIPIQTLTATATAPTGASVVWYDAATAGAVVTAPTLNACGTVTYYAESQVGTAPNICVSATRTAVTLTINCLPLAPTTGGDQTQCETIPIQTLTATATAPTGASVVWYDAATAGAVVTAPTLNACGTVTYYAESQVGTAPNICVSATRTAVTLTINCLPLAPTTGGDQTQCETIPIQTLTATATAPTGASIVWYDAATGGTVVTAPILNVCGTVTYYAESQVGTAPNICVSATRTAVTLTINCLPLAPTTGGDQTQCETLPIQTLTATATAPTGASVVWYDAATGGTVVTAPILNVCGTVTYYAESQVGTAPNICVSATRTAVTLTINCLPLSPTTGGDQTQCETLPIQTLTATATAPTGASIVWYDAATGGTVVTAPSLNACGTVTYYAESQVGTAPNICVSATRTAVTLTINCLPLAPTTGGDQTQCETLPIQTLTATATAPTGASLVWYDAATGGTVVTAPSLNACGTVTYYAESQVGTAPNICVSATRTAVTLTINCLPLAPTTGGDQTQCETLPIQTLTATATAPTGASIVWYDAATGGAIVANPTLNTVGTTIYYAQAVDATTGCVSAIRTPVTLTIFAIPTAPSAVVQTPICATTPIQTLTAQATPPAGASIVWYDAATLGAVVTAPTLNACGTVIYYAESQVGIAPNICVSTTRTPVTLTINCLPAAPSAIAAQAVCAANPLQTLTATATPPLGATLAWYTASTGGTLLTSQTLNSIGSVTYYAQSVDSATGCVSATRTPVTLRIDDSPKFGIIGGCIGNAYTLEITPIANYIPATATYQWEDALGNPVGTNAPTLIAKTAGNYSCTIINTDGCSSEETYVANTVSCSIQKGISPKGIGVGDGNNDFFDLEALNVTKLQIFNRYGLAVYTKNEYKKEWYGQSDSNNELPDGTYYYVIETKDADPVTGWIYINREQ